MSSRGGGSFFNFFSANVRSWEGFTEGCFFMEFFAKCPKLI
jgi:hypothetical protein